MPETIAIRGKKCELFWLKSDLSDSRQFCRVNGVDSKFETIETGVPKDHV